MTRAKDAASGLAEREALKPLAERSDRHGLIQLAGHTGALVATGATVAQSMGSIWLALAMLVHGVILAFLFAPLHETIHRTAFRRRRLNDVTAWLCGLAVALPPAYFRAFHFAHHRHTQDPEHDPELAVPKPDSLSAYLRHVSGVPYWWSRLTTMVRHASGRVDEPFIGPRQRPGIVREARVYLALYALVLAVPVAAGSSAVLVFWLIPSLLGQPFLRCYLLAEHTGCPFLPDAEELENDAQHRSGAAARLEHAVPRRASRPPFAAVSRAAARPSGARAQDRGPGARLRRRQSRDPRRTGKGAGDLRA